ncbi:DUF294 nucleotidyltransferase-like domain-containing protein [Marinicella sp. W31]|uniref:DUF294 nucleotidyltransferase-like domain-containing protein n=1 Tax=Marinicella sp. W31 TaxID=3023713 RepID=UPI00375637DB
MSAPTSIPAITDFYAALSPFDELSEALLQQVVQSTEVFFCDQSSHPLVDFHDPHLFVIRSGEYEIRSQSGRLIDRLAEGDQFGVPSLLSGEEPSNQLVILKAGLIYRVSANVFHQLRRDDDSFERFYTKAYAHRLAQADRSVSTRSYNQSVGSIITRKPATVTLHAEVGEAAHIMQQRRVSSLLVLHEDTLVGILTDRDLRNRVLAQGLSHTTAVADVMTMQPLSIQDHQSLTTALSLMLEHDIHHLPVLDSSRQVMGMITTNDVLQTQMSHPIFLLGRMRKANRREQLIQYSADLGNLLWQLMRSGTSVYEAGKIFTQVTDVLTRRLIELAIEQLGSPPMSFAWMAFGSQARMEQAANSDQDNGILLSAQPSEDQQAYFSQLAAQVNAGLDACGFIYCPGDVMAQNPKWCVSSEQWIQYFTDWIGTPEPKALLHASIFFDMRCIYGEQSLVESLQQQVLSMAADNDIFLALMTQNALESQIPLGFFKQFVLQKDGAQKNTLDLKKNGLLPLVEITRIHALAAQTTAVNTLERLNTMAAEKYLNSDDVASLTDSYRFIARLRFEHQIQCWQQGLAANNHLAPDAISRLQQKHLKSAFSVLADAQQGLKMRYTRGLM